MNDTLGMKVLQSEQCLLQDIVSATLLKKALYL